MPLVKVKGTPVDHRLHFFTSANWTVPYNCKALIVAVGGGGGGGVATGSSTAEPVAANGGDAGGVAVHEAVLSAGTVLTITPGASGAVGNLSNTNTPSSINGSSGGTTTVSGGGISLTANGGNGGQTATLVRGSSTPGTTVLAATQGAAAGTASGGNIMNVTGGKGGDTSIVLNSASTGDDCLGVTGGGAIGILGVGQDGGSVTRTGTLAGDRMLTGGAASIGLPGLSLNDTTDDDRLVQGRGAHSDSPAGRNDSPLSDGYAHRDAFWGGGGGSSVATDADYSITQSAMHAEQTKDYCLFNLNGPGGFYGNAQNYGGGFGYLGGSGGSMYSVGAGSRWYTLGRIHGGAGGVGAGGGAHMNRGGSNNIDPDIFVGGVGGNYGGGGGGCAIARRLDNVSAGAFGGLGGRGGVYIKIVEIY
jgi:hypothetical protein